MNFLILIIAVGDATVHPFIRNRYFIPMMPIRTTLADGTNTTVATILTLFGSDFVLAGPRRAFLGIGPGSRIQQRHGSILLLNSSLVCGAERAVFESACQPDSIATASFASENSLLGMISYDTNPSHIPEYLFTNSTAIISLESDGKMLLERQIDRSIRATLHARGARYQVSGNSTHRYVTDCYAETIVNLPQLVVNFYTRDPCTACGSLGYSSGSIAIDVPIIHDPSTNFCYLDYGVVQDGIPSAIPFLAIPGVIVYFNATHISLCDGF